MIDFRKALAKALTPKGAIWFGGIVLGMFVILLIFDNFLMPWYTKHGEALTVPNTVAQRYEDAKDLLEISDLEAVKAGEKSDPNLPFGYVVEQNPKANRLVKKGRRIYLTISVGEREVLVPTLVGLSENNAEERLKSVGLRLGEVDYAYVPDEVNGVVIAQSIAPSSLVKASVTVDMTISLGEPTGNVTVPSVLSKTLDVATRLVQKAGLNLGRVDYIINDGLLPSTVIDQSINPGMVAEPGDTLNVVVTTVTGQEM